MNDGKRRETWNNWGGIQKGQNFIICLSGMTFGSKSPVGDRADDTITSPLVMIGEKSN